MTSDNIQTVIKSNLGSFIKDGKEERVEWNKAVWAVCTEIANQTKREMTAKVKALESTAEVDVKNKGIQELMDNPMTEEQESKALRAIYQQQLSSGDLSPQLLDKIDKIIGVGTGKDEEIQIVTFKDAFPDYATAIEYCGKPQPKVCECGGVK